MALGQEITDRYFLDQQFFVVEFDTDAWDRKTFTEFGPLKFNIGEKVHKESGSPIPWRGAGTVTYENITAKRGLGLDLPPAGGGVLDRDMYNWAQAAVEGQDVGGAGGFKRDFNTAPHTRAGQGYGFHWRVEGAVPVSYTGFEGDANSEDVSEETIEIGVERWWIPDTSPYEFETI